jgi:glutaconate CoA-transferase subunit B
VEWTTRQMMAITMARQIEDGQSYIVGTGLPLVAVALAKASHAPNATLIFETALIDGDPQEVPTSVSDLRLNYKASVLWPQYRYFGYQAISSQRGGVAYGFLGGAQIDPYGNLNSTCIGDYFKPKTRFTGSGGANGIATYCDTIIMMQHEKRRFIEKVDYITSPGWMDGPGGREKVGLPGNKGPRVVVTELGIMKFDEDTKRIYLAEYYPGVTVEQIVENTGFKMDVSRAVQAPPPTEEELTILLTKVDPQRLMV